jgi:hypothetical protein
MDEHRHTGPHTGPQHDRDESINEPGITEPARESGSPLGTDPQEASPLPGDPREAQQPQEPRTTHVEPGSRTVGSDHQTAGRPGSSDRDSDDGVVDQIREVWDRLRGKDQSD